MSGPRKPEWEEEGRDWPHREASRFVEAAGLRWHVQVMGTGAPLLLLHGAGAATHSWRGLAPLLARRFTIIAPDLPGHGFTATPPAPAGLSLPGMARAVAGLVDVLGAAPRAIVGHSAGAAIAVRIALDRRLAVSNIVSINGALLPFPGLAAHLFPPAARLLFVNPLATHLVARRAADRSRVAQLMRSTGSDIDDAGLEQYARLFRTPGHVAGVLGMMANWDLTTLRRDIRRLDAHLTLLVGDRDRAVAPRVADDVRALLPRAQRVTLPGLGHLAHEEAPHRVAAAIEAALGPD